MKMSKLSNQTNSQDPQAVNSRVFVGNLNTFQCSKTDVERMFQRYGRLVGISMHKGYAFVQFTNPFDARNACHGEDGRTVLSQTLDVNMVAEPKAHQVGRKRQNVTKTGNDWDYYYDSYYSSTLFRAAGTRPLKRKRLMTSQGNKLNAAVVAAAAVQQQQQQQQHQQQQVAAAAMAAMANLLPQQQQILLHQQNLLTNGTNGIVTACNGNGTSPHHSLSQYVQQQHQHQQALMPAAVQTAPAAPNGLSGLNNCEQISALCATQMQQQQQPQTVTQPQTPQWGPYKIYSNPDTLICGNCRECFADLGELLDHKRTYCKLRFTCKCQDIALASKTPLPGAKLLCAVCKDAFTNPWDLMVHAQAAHMVNIYELGNEANNNNVNGADSEQESMSLPKTNGALAINGVSSCNNSISGDGNGSDLEQTIEMAADNCRLNGGKEETHPDDTSLDGRMSVSSPALQSDDIKLNGSVSSRGSSPALEAEEPRACIVRTLSIEASRTPSPPTAAAIGMMASSLAISLTNGAATVSSQ